jgi:hypothetical protein
MLHIQRHAGKAEIFLTGSLVRVQRALVHVKSKAIFNLYIYISAISSQCVVFLARTAAPQY